FRGTVQQVRLEPKVDQNVVTYDVVIRVPNPDKKLMPGMTANLTIAVTEKRNVLSVPVAALRFHPPREGGDTARPPQGRDRGGETAALRTGGRATPGGGGAAEGGEGRSGRIHLLMDGRPMPVKVKTGLSDGSRTEIEVKGEGEVKEGDPVIVGIDGAAGAQNAARPFGMQPGGAGGRRRGF
ncbi:MAG TPA: efflux RND transporter periplasmic adaptor subunit, partial [Fibrobacteria bacterium]|nr:efflux RND transporter periplasmic adaptor subunit [Fibrobacteria bacterium]